MTRWRAVLAGFALAACSEALVFALTGRVTLVGGLAGSAFAGYLVGPEPADGAWHGLLSSLAWGTLLIPGLVALAVTGDGTLPFPYEYLAPLFTTSGAATTGILLSVTLPNAIAGAVGGVASDARDDGDGGAATGTTGGRATRATDRGTNGDDVGWLGSNEET
ncbi:hypothetical protein SAMN04488063_2376 [Halopelagius inordinatus]|uniref:Uncharacterized protein n=1 Tax=Halopelagius inordinatus TaxID=553467 RepID=A0A1I2SV04_9EURY|nr:DUF5518 domain-containing protein [Halopelagius inordinatus]SFG54757.1 hypothetical protein SAMN04488063_2376 [Halopelagius inordinatus]